MTTHSDNRHTSLRQKIRELDALLDAQAEAIRKLEQERDEARGWLAKTSTDLNATIGALAADCERMEQDLGYKSKRIEDLYAENQRLVAETQRLAEQRDGLQLGLDAMRTDREAAWASHAQEMKTREGWVQAYREALARAEKAEQALDAAMAVVRENAEGMDSCVTAGPQCHYKLPYAACMALLAVLASDALQHVHTYAPDTGKCSCGHAESDDSR